MATPNITPRKDEEGNIGGSLRKWLKGWFKDIFISGSITDGTNSFTVSDLNAALNSGITYKGGYDASSNTPDLDTSPAAGTISKGDFYTVTVAGVFFSANVEIGDVVIAEIDDAAVEADWTILQKNLDAASIKTLYESNADTNAFTDTEQTKLAGIEDGAEVNVNADWNAGSGDAEILNKPSSLPPDAHTHTASEVTDFDTEVGNHADVSQNTTDRHTHSNKTVLDNTTASFTTEEETKLSGIATGATVNDTDANLKNRANHTGTQLANTISDFSTAVSSNAAVAANTSKVTNANHTGDVTGSTALTIANNAVTNAKAAQMAANTVKTNNTGGTANASDVVMAPSTFLARLASGNIVAATVAQATALLNVFTSSLKGLVPSSGGGTTKYLRADGTWAVPAGGSSSGTAPINITSGVVSGSATSGFLASTNNMVEYEIQGGGGGASKIVYYSVIVPQDYVSGGKITIDSWTTDNVGLTTWTVTAYINGTIDSSINATSIKPNANTTYQTTNTTFGSALVDGNVIQIKLNFTGSANDDIRIRRVELLYTK